MTEEIEELVRLYPGGRRPSAGPLHPSDVQAKAGALKLDPSGASSPSLLSALNSVRHRIRDGVPLQDTTPVAFRMVRLESLSDQVVATATPVQTVFQCRYADVPTQRYMNAQVVPGTLVAYLDGAWTPTHPTVDVDTNGNFTLPTPPVAALLITYAYQYLSDGEIYENIDNARKWLREFSSVTLIPDGLSHALVSYAAALCLEELQVTATLAPVDAGDSRVDWSKLADAYGKAATVQYARAERERLEFYTQGPEALDPTALDVSAPTFRPYTPEH